MNANIKIRRISFLIMIVSLVISIILGICNQLSVLYNISLALFGSASLSYITAKVSYNSDVTRIKRKIILNIIHIQTEVKKILSEYSKTLDFWDENDFYEFYSNLNNLIDDFFRYNKIVKFEIGKEILEFIEVENILDIYNSYIQLNSDIHLVGILLENKDKNSAYEQYINCIDYAKNITDKIKVLLKNEYGKAFANINSIGLL